MADFKTAQIRLLKVCVQTADADTDDRPGGHARVGELTTKCSFLNIGTEPTKIEHNALADRILRFGE